MKNRPFYSILSLVCILILLSAPVLMAAGDAKAVMTQSSSDCCKGMKSSEKRCSPSPRCCTEAPGTSARASLDKKTPQLKAESSSEVSKASLAKAKSED